MLIYISLGSLLVLAVCLCLLHLSRTVVWFCMNSRESRWPFLYLSAGTRTHFAFRQSTVRELAFTYGFISNADGARQRMCDVWQATDAIPENLPPQRKIRWRRRRRHGEDARRKIGYSAGASGRAAYAIFPSDFIVAGFCVAVLVCASLASHGAATGIGIKLEDTSVIFAIAFTLTDFDGERAVTRDATKQRGKYESRCVDSQVVGKWRN